MADKITHLEKILILSQSLEKKGFEPVLVGGIALVILGSQRVTKDFDFLVSIRDSPVDDIVNVFYEHGFELVTKFNSQGEVMRSIDNRRVAISRLKLDLSQTLFFFDWKTRLKVDVLLDFPFPAKEIARRATKIKIKSRSLRIASHKDLIRMKEIAFKDRGKATDAQDLEFLRSLKK